MLGQRYDTAGQLVAQSAGARQPASLGRSTLGWNVPSGEGVTRRDGIQRRYEYDRALAPTRIDDGLWGELRFDYDDNGQLTRAAGARGAERFSYDPARNLAGASSAAPFSPGSAGYRPAFDAAFGTVTPAAKPEIWRRSAGGVVQIARGPKGERAELQHDACGRLIDRKVTRDGFRPKRWRYRWDAHDRLVEAERVDGETWLFRYDPFGRRVSKVRRFGERERAEAAQRWPRLVDGEGAPTPERPIDRPGLTPLPEVGTAYLWDGDHMIAEAALYLDGYVDWERATRWLFHENDFYCHTPPRQGVARRHGTAGPHGSR